MFYGSEYSDLKPVNPEYAFIGSLDGLYQMLLGCWRRETCAPRLRDKWSESNSTCGQCSITAFLVQDIFGGEVYGVPNGDGSFHCFNKVGDAVLIHDTEYTKEPKSEEQKAEMRDRVRDILTKVLGGLEREVKVFVDRDAGSNGRKCCCTSATYVVAKGEIPT